MKIDLTGKTAVVTGATAGIGLAIATGLARAGAEVALVGRDQGRLNAAVEQVRRDSGTEHVLGILADPGTPKGCQTVISAQPEADILINNLGIYPTKDFFEINDEDWQSIFDVNVMSGVRLARHYAQGMKARGWGRIQFVSSESALNIPAEMVHYGVSKAALQAVSRGLAKVLAGTGVTVNAILPGPTRTEGATAMMAQLGAERGLSAEEMETVFLKENRPSGLLQRFATPEEVANMSVYAASPQASATTGSALRVEGGIVESIA
jgi:NAD(P)-dependent dehydrogenase (short-subunit alcohol dehydrogenase family)